tara:strand:- start:274 stop:648 length:375 start_codon:yes stop_codon:yes gene_type:complete
MRNAIQLNDHALKLLHLRVLKIIDSADEPVTANDIVQKTLIDKAQLARLIKELMSNGYIVKLDNTQDKRSYFLQLTAAGDGIMQLLSTAEIEMNDVMKGTLSDSEINEFKRIATIMADNLNNNG